MLKVVVHEKGGRTQRFNFESDQFSVGREEDNDLVLDRVNISKHHLRFRRSQGSIEIIDLGSTNGTYVNGRKVAQPRSVRRADRIYVGDYILMLEGDDTAIAPVQRSEIIIAGDAAHPERRAVAVPPPHRDNGEALEPQPVPTPLAHLTADDADDILTSAKRVAAAGMESTYVDKVVNRIIQTALANINSLDPTREAEVSEEDTAAANSLIDSLVSDMRRSGELEEDFETAAITGQAKRELLELGPLTELMKDDTVREIQVVGSGSIRVVHQRTGGRAEIELTGRRFSGDRALVLAIHRMARTWGLLHEGSQVLEGKVDEGFWMYALLPPTQVRHPVLNLRRQRTDASNLAALVQEGVLSADMAELLSAAIRGSRRIMVSASGGTNLDRFMGALVGEIPDELRVCCISDSGSLGEGRRGWLQVRRMADPADTIGLSDALGVLLRGGGGHPGLAALSSRGRRRGDGRTVRGDPRRDRLAVGHRLGPRAVAPGGAVDGGLGRDRSPDRVAGPERGPAGAAQRRRQRRGTAGHRDHRAAGARGERDRPRADLPRGAGGRRHLEVRGDRRGAELHRGARRARHRGAAAHVRERMTRA